MSTPQELADRLRKWYAGGEAGLQKICEQDDLDSIRLAAIRWFEQGHKRLDAIISELEKLGKDTSK